MDFLKRLGANVKCLLALNAVLYVTFVYLDIRGMYSGISAVLKYAGILSCLGIAFFVRARAFKLRDANLQTLCLAITVVADYFLLFTDKFYLGTAIFCAAHLTALRRYSRRLLFWFGVLGTLAMAIRIITGTIEPGVGFLGGFRLLPAGLPALDGIYIGYALLITLVTIAAFLYKQPRPNRRLSSAGMCLFLLCDVNVFLFNYLPPGGHLHAAAAILMWAFYLPAQTLLSLSAAKSKR